MATMMPHNPPKRLHEEAINQYEDPMQSGSIKRPRVISPRSPLSQSAATVEVFPDAIDFPEDIHQRRKHSLDTLSEEDSECDSQNEVEGVENLASGQSGSHRRRQRRRIDADPFQNNLDEENSMAHRVMLPSEAIRKIPEVVLDSDPHPHFTKFSANKTTALPQQSGTPIIEEIPYNPLAIVPYSPPPVIFFPGLSNGAYDQGPDTVGDEMLVSTQKGKGDEGGDQAVDEIVDAMEVLPMLTPTDAGCMLSPGIVNSTTASYDENGADDAMEE